MLAALRIALTRINMAKGTVFEEYDYHICDFGDSPQSCKGILIELWFREETTGEWSDSLIQALTEIIQTDVELDLDSIGFRISSKYTSGSGSYIESVDKRRFSHNKTDRHVREYGEYIEIIGAAGELVVRRFLGLSEELPVQFDGGVHLIFLGKTVYVKATKLTSMVLHRHLQWPLWKPITSDIIVLTAIDTELKYGELMGYALRSEVLKAKINYQRKFPCYEIPISELHPCNQLLQEKVVQ